MMYDFLDYSRPMKDDFIISRRKSLRTYFIVRNFTIFYIVLYIIYMHNIPLNKSTYAYKLCRDMRFFFLDRTFCESPFGIFNRSDRLRFPSYVSYSLKSLSLFFWLLSTLIIAMIALFARGFKQGEPLSMIRNSYWIYYYNYRSVLLYKLYFIIYKSITDLSSYLISFD